MKLKFAKCSICGNIIAFVHNSGVMPVCCNKPMGELIPNTTDAAHEKHVPVITINGTKVTVTVGSVPHPMTEEHQIEWIALQTQRGNQRQSLKPGEKPSTCFSLCEGDTVVAAYAYCNLHGLWKQDC
ncbi:MAG: desulfoferrodoxin family protein [Kiritimatiellia bacterium]